MEQELIDFDEWLISQQSRTINYSAVYNEEGQVISIGPSAAYDHLTNKVPIDEEFANLVFEGRETLLSFKVDLTTKQLIKLSKFVTHSLTRIDDVLHRIIDEQWSSFKNPDVTVTYDETINELSFSINSKYKKLIWEGDTEMIFLITDYNDPNVLFEMISVLVGDITDNDKVFTIALPKKFSIYTRRIFDQYVFKTK
jgi:hypothetical protein